MQYVLPISMLWGARYHWLGSARTMLPVRKFVTLAFSWPDRIGSGFDPILGLDEIGGDFSQRRHVIARYGPEPIQLR